MINDDHLEVVEGGHQIVQFGSGCGGAGCVGQVGQGVVLGQKPHGWDPRLLCRSHGCRLSDLSGPHKCLGQAGATADQVP